MKNKLVKILGAISVGTAIALGSSYYALRSNPPTEFPEKKLEAIAKFSSSLGETIIESVIIGSGEAIIIQNFREIPGKFAEDAGFPTPVKEVVGELGGAFFEGMAIEYFKEYNKNLTKYSKAKK